MATENLTTRMGKKWWLMEHLPAGPVKDELAELQTHIEWIEGASTVLLNLVKIEREIDGAETITLAIDTLFALGCSIESNADSVFYHLTRLFAPKEQPAGGKTERQAPEKDLQATPDMVLKLVDVLSCKEELPPVLVEAITSKITAAHEELVKVRQAAPEGGAA